MRLLPLKVIQMRLLGPRGKSFLGEMLFKGGIVLLRNCSARCRETVHVHHGKCGPWDAKRQPARAEKNGRLRMKVSNLLQKSSLWIGSFKLHRGFLTTYST